MAEITRKGSGEWKGDLKSGSGTLSLGSGVLDDQDFSFGTRFEDKPGTNPEELVAAAHAACFSMAFANTLADKGHKPQRIATVATCVLVPSDGGFKISEMRLDVRGQVEGMDDETFRAMAEAGDKSCVISNALRGNVEIKVEAKLE